MIASEKRRESGRQVQLRLIKEGRHNNWKSRNITSYPELFWKKVLDNHNIKYIFNAPIPKKSLGEDCQNFYFLDFLIGGKIDLEIDGKQHRYSERSESDQKRDILLIKNGYIVYRIAWNEISSKEGSLLMKQKIEQFLNWLKNKEVEKLFIKDYELPTKYEYKCRICGKTVKTNIKNRSKHFYCSKECLSKGRHLPRK